MTRKQFGVKAGILLVTIVVLFGFTRDGQLSVFESAVILVFFAIFLAENLIAGRREQENEASESDAQAPRLTLRPWQSISLSLYLVRLLSCLAHSC